MSVDLLITQRSFIKKALPLEVILGDELRYGAMETGCRLNMDVLGDGEFVAYLPQHIGRGISVEWKKGEKQQVALRMLSPTCSEEVDAFYRIVQRIAGVWKCDVEMDGNLMSVKEFLATREEIQKFNIDTIKGMFKRIVEEDGGATTIFSAMWPMVVGKEEAECFLKEPEAFGPWLHEKQVQDLYYAVPLFYRDEQGGVIGRYAISEDVDSIIPVEPHVPFGVIDPDTGKMLECSNYMAAFYSHTYDRVIGEVPYERFMDVVPKAKISRYDGGSYVMKGLTLEELESILES